MPKRNAKHIGEESSKKSESESSMLTRAPAVAGPKNWLRALENIRQMRREKNAPVDTMGCGVLADPLASPKLQRYQCLISLMLSSQVSV